MRQKPIVVRDRTVARSRFFHVQERLLRFRDGTELHAERLLDLFRQELKAEEQCVTASIGATAWQPEEQIKVWMARTDQALYEAKEGGRDQVVVH